MKKAAAHSSTLRHEQNLTAANVHSEPMLLDTAWRIVVPVVVFTVLGVLADRHFDSTPWLALLGLVVGSLSAGILVKYQNADLPEDEK